MYKDNHIVDSHASVPNRQIAILIDGDNAQPSLLEAMLAETGKYGLVTIRRIYGDWTSQNMKGWKDALQVHAIQPLQQFRYTIGKNATDSAMIIDAMDILYGGMVNGFCLVSSDSDYTRLATRIREKGLFVMGIGKRTTPRAFINACEIFVYTENLVTEPEPQRQEAPARRRAAPRVPRRTQQAAEPVAPPSSPSQLLRRAFDMAVQEDGWAFLGTMGSRLRQLDPSFDPRTYGSRQLSTLIRTYPNIFEVKEVKTEAEGPAHVYVRLREPHAEVVPPPSSTPELPFE